MDESSLTGGFMSVRKTQAIPYTLFLAVLACKPVSSESSKEQATPRGPAGQSLRCNQVLPSVQKVAIANLSQMVAYAKGGGKNTQARKVAEGTVQMLENMMRHPTQPIHPIAFYAAVKDFESATSLRWSSNASGAFRTGNCTSGECLGLFQVDVRIESQWRGGAFCQSGGLNLWGKTTGAVDFCAAQFWWISAEGGRKCDRIAASSKGNPCTSPNYMWTLADVRNGRRAYVQAIQPGWDSNAWAEMYKNYERCYTAKQPLLEAVGDFRRAVGLASVGVADTEQNADEQSGAK